MSTLPALLVARWRFRLRPSRSLRFLAPSPAVALRGAFGYALRSAVCPTPEANCFECPFAHECVFWAVFESREPGRTRALRHQTPPRPFLLRPVDPACVGLDPAEPFDCELLLLGDAISHAPIVLSSVLALFEQGLGPERAPLRLERAQVLDARGLPLVEGRDALRCHDDALFDLRQLERPSDANCAALRLHFETPLRIAKEETPALELDPADLVLAAMRRVCALAATHEIDVPLYNRNELAARCNTLQVLERDLRWRSAERGSTRTGQRHELDGAVGTLALSGDLHPIMPWLRAAELLQVGRKTAFGLGRLRVERLD